MLNKTVKKRFSEQKKKAQAPVVQFFAEHCDKIAVSFEMGLLLQCYVLAVTREPYQTLENGVVLTRTNTSFLDRLSKDITKDLQSVWTSKIVERWQEDLSAESMSFLREEAAKSTSLDFGSFQLMQRMLSEEMTHVFTPDKKYAPKTFGCIFYEYKAILARMGEEMGIFGIKNVGTSSWCLFKPQEPKGKFLLVSDEECSALDPKRPILVLEGVVVQEMPAFSRWVDRYGLNELVLACAAEAPPYARKSTLLDIKDTAAQGEVAAFRDRYVSEIGSQFILDHVFCATYEELRGLK